MGFVTVKEKRITGMKSGKISETVSFLAAINKSKIFALLRFIPKF